jgi:hypothetical protein
MQLSNDITWTLERIALYIAEIRGWIRIEFTQIFVLLPSWRCEFLQLYTVDPTFTLRCVNLQRFRNHVSFRMKSVSIIGIVLLHFYFVPYYYTVGF